MYRNKCCKSRGADSPLCDARERILWQIREVVITELWLWWKINLSKKKKYMSKFCIKSLQLSLCSFKYQSTHLWIFFLQVQISIYKFRFFLQALMFFFFLWLQMWIIFTSANFYFTSANFYFTSANFYFTSANFNIQVKFFCSASSHIVFYKLSRFAPYLPS